MYIQEVFSRAQHLRRNDFICVWTEAGIAKLTELFWAGKTNPEIQRIIGCITTQQVSRKLIELGLARSRTSPWTEENVAKLRALWGDGKSASQCAREIGGMTRNAVIGKVARLGLPERACKHRSPHIRNRKRTRAAGQVFIVPLVERQERVVRGPALERTALPPEPPRPSKLFKLADMEDHQCRYFYGDPRAADSGYCGCKKMPGSSFCPGHHGKVWQGVSAKPRKSTEHPSCSRSAQSFGGKYRNKEVAL